MSGVSPIRCTIELFRRPAGLAAIVFMLIGAAAIGYGASGGLTRLPGPLPPGQKPPKPSGLAMSIDTAWIATNGYRPVGISIAPTTPITADRTLMIRLSPVEGQINYQYGADIGVTQQFDIAASSNGLSGTILVPQRDLWGRVKIDVFEDGKPVDDLSREDVYVNSETTVLYSPASGGPNGGISYSSSGTGLGRSPVVLQIGGSIANAGASSGALFQDGLNPWSWLCIEVDEDSAKPPMTVPVVAPAAFPRVASVSELPQRWLDYSGVDIFILSLPKLRDLVTNHPRQWTAIRSAIAAGGNLWVYDVGDRWERLPELEKIVDFGADEGALSQWRTPKPEAAQASDSGRDGVPTDKPARKTPEIAAKKPDLSAPALFRPLELGQVIAIGKSDPLGASQNFDWPWLLKAAGTRRLCWTARHGLLLAPEELESNKGDFWEFLIPGVGLTPVLQFQILISLFVIGIGPVNYFLLRRWRRLSLLLITVPASAAVVTLALFGYALIHDGLGVRVRARTFTQLDMRRGEAVCWSRLSYYAGLSSSNGLTFPGDIAVYPFEQEPPPRFRGTDGRAKEISWQEPESPVNGKLLNQHFSTDWLPSRTPTQFITVRSRKTTARLNISKSAPGAPLKVENRLGTRIHSIVVTDAAGSYFAGGEVAVTATATLAPLAADSALKTIQKTLSDNGLQLPDGAQINWFQQPNNYNYSYPRRQYYNPIPVSSSTNPFQIISSGPAPQREATLEQSLHDWSQSLEPRSFVAIVERSPEVVFGLDSAGEEGSLHVIAGRW